MMYNMDRLFEAVSERGHVCVGLDTSPDYLPSHDRRVATGAESVLAFNYAIIDATVDIAACYKVQIAYYEALGKAGIETYAKTLSYLRQKKALVIADIKRGDIADTALHYAKAHFEGDFEADFVTLSPYMGMDSIDPWLSYAESKGKGAFVLLRTSNNGMRDFQNLEIIGKAPPPAGGGGTPPLVTLLPPAGVTTPAPPTVSVEQRRLYHAVGDKLSELAAQRKGKNGYGVFGAVVGADPKTGEEREEAIAIRNRYKNLFFLIPGYGAQGGAAEDAALLLRDGNGGVVNASRSILKAWTNAANTGEVNNVFAAEAARKAAITMRDSIRESVKKK